MAGTVYQKNGTLAGAPATVDIQSDARMTAKWVIVSNDDASNTYDITIQGFASKLYSGEAVKITGSIKRVTLNGTGAYRVWAGDLLESAPSLDIVKPAGITSGSVGTSELADNSVTNAKMADNAISTAEIAAGALAASAAGRGKMADDYFTATEVSTVGAGGKFDANCIDATGSNHLFAANSLDATFCASKIATLGIPATKLESGGAAAGVDGSKTKFHANVAGGGTLTVNGVPELIFGVTIPDTTGNVDFTVGPQKILITDVWFTYNGTGAAGDTFQLQTAAGAANITDAISGSATANALRRAGVLANNVVLGGAGLRVAVNDGGAVCSGTLWIKCVPVA